MAGAVRLVTVDRGLRLPRLRPGRLRWRGSAARGRDRPPDGHAAGHRAAVARARLGLRRRHRRRAGGPARHRRAASRPARGERHRRASWRASPRASRTSSPRSGATTEARDRSVITHVACRYLGQNYEQEVRMYQGHVDRSLRAGHRHRARCAGLRGPPGGGLPRHPPTRRTATTCPISPSSRSTWARRRSCASPAGGRPALRCRRRDARASGADRGASWSPPGEWVGRTRSSRRDDLPVGYAVRRSGDRRGAGLDDLRAARLRASRSHPTSCLAAHGDEHGRMTVTPDAPPAHASGPRRPDPAPQAARQHLRRDGGLDDAHRLLADLLRGPRLLDAHPRPRRQPHRDGRAQPRDAGRVAVRRHLDHPARSVPRTSTRATSGSTTTPIAAARTCPST